MTGTAPIARLAAAAAAAPLAALALVLLGGCGARGARTAPPAAHAAAGAGASGGFALGLTEDNAALLWSPEEAARAPARAAPPGGPRVRLARAELSALRPRYVRLLIDWAALQPDPGRAPALEAGVSGCARAIGPCAPYAGVREELAAIASQQRARAPSGAEGAFQVVIDIFGTPAWAARPPSGCERAGAGSFSRAPSAAGIAAYRALIHELVALGAREGVALEWWSPWNEPNDPAFLGPQRSSCDAGAPSQAPSLYAELARAMAAQLRAEGGPRHLLVGELNGFQSGSADRASIAQFVGALPADVLCAGDAFSLHAYAARERFAPARDAVGVLEAALHARGGCARGERIWVTEAGAGAAHPGAPRPAGAAEARAGCVALAGQLQRWHGDPRVGAVFQYTFRDDPAFPVGLIDARLSRPYPAYGLWLAWARALAAGDAPPAPAQACAT